MVWDALELNPKIIEALKKAKLTSYDSVLLASVGELVRQTKLSVKEVINLRKVVSKAVRKHPPVTALQLSQPAAPNSKPSDNAKLTTGCKILDNVLRGGLLVHRITEVAGESASGKTQFCLQLALAAQLPLTLGGLNSSVAYICTEDAFPVKRLQQIIVAFRKQHSQVPTNLGDNVFIEHVADFDTMKLCVRQQLPALINGRNVGLVILDSVAAIFRSDYNQHQFRQRSQDVQWLGKELHRLCSDFGVTVVCVNQVTDVIRQNFSSTCRRVVPSLGLMWANLVTTRLMLSRANHAAPLLSNHQHAETGMTLANSVTRTFEVVFAPNLPQIKCSFIVDASGMRGLQTSR